VPEFQFQISKICQLGVPKIGAALKTPFVPYMLTKNVMGILYRLFLRTPKFYPWLVVLTILKNISQWEGLSHILWNIKNVWTHQPVMLCCLLSIFVNFPSGSEELGYPQFRFSSFSRLKWRHLFGKWSPMFRWTQCSYCLSHYPIVKPHVKWDNYPIIPLSHRIASISHYPIVWIFPLSHCKIPIQTPSTLVNEEPQHGTNTNVGKHPCHFATRGAEKDAELVLSVISTAWKLVLENQTILKIANSMFQTSVLW